MNYKQPDQMLTHYQEKSEIANNSEKRHSDKIANCLSKISELENLRIKLLGTNYKRRQRKIENKLNHWKQLLSDLQDRLNKFEQKSTKYNDETMKWIGIVEKIKNIEIANEITKEKRMIGNKYGFNPLAQSRETAEIMFED
jgi:hypothetical protein